MGRHLRLVKAETEREEVLGAFRLASESAREKMLEQGQAYLNSRMQMLIALEQRCTQATTLLMAAAAVTMSLTLQAHRDMGAVLCGALAIVSFTVGAGLGFAAIVPGKQLVPGMEPDHWIGVDNLAKLDKQTTEETVIDSIQQTLQSMDRQGARRAVFLRAALAAGGCGVVTLATLGGMLAVGAITAAIR